MNDDVQHYSIGDFLNPDRVKEVNSEYIQEYGASLYDDCYLGGYGKSFLEIQYP